MLCKGTVKKQSDFFLAMIFNAFVSYYLRPCKCRQKIATIYNSSTIFFQFSSGEIIVALSCSNRRASSWPHTHVRLPYCYVRWALCAWYSTVRERITISLSLSLSRRCICTLNFQFKWRKKRRRRTKNERTKPKQREDSNLLSFFFDRQFLHSLFCLSILNVVFVSPYSISISFKLIQWKMFQYRSKSSDSIWFDSKYCCCCYCLANVPLHNGYFVQHTTHSMHAQRSYHVDLRLCAFSSGQIE